MIENDIPIGNKANKLFIWLPFLYRRIFLCRSANLSILFPEVDIILLYYVTNYIEDGNSNKILIESLIQESHQNG